MSILTSLINVDRRGHRRDRRPWQDIHSWVGWLNGPDLLAIGRTDCELVLVDYSADASAQGEFTPEQVERLRRSGPGRRVIAYLSVGEAERHRYYWQRAWRPGSPSWIVAENPEWPGDHLIEYWHPGWQSIVLAYLDRILAQGFDGVYLDWVDAYDNPYAVAKEPAMVELVLRVARYARRCSSLGEDFGVFAHNAEALTTRYSRLTAELTGILREEVYVAATDKPIPETERARVEADLSRFRASSPNKLVLTIDYANRPDLIAEARGRARMRGFVPYVAGVALDRLATDLVT